jgi:hypothetical protein
MASQRCPSCGEPVKAGARFCAKCGARQPEPPRGSDEPTQILPAIPPVPEQTPTPGPQRIPSAPPTQPAGGPSQPPGYGSAQPPAAEKRGFPWLIVGLAGVGLLLVLGIGVAALALRGRDTGGTAGDPTRAPTAASSSDNSPTATAEARLAARTATAEARFAARTATAEMRATAGVQSDAQATAGAQAAADEQTTADAQAAAEEQATAAAQVAADEQATAAAQVGQATAIAQATAETAALFANARQVFFDEFVDNRNNWFTGQWSDQETDVIEGGVFKVLWSGAGASFELYEVRGLNNFIAQVDCVVAKGDADGSCGIIFAQTPDVGLYKFEVFNDYYRLSVFQQDQDTKVLLDGDPAGIVNPNNTNRLKVVRINNQAFLYLNDQLLDTNTDTTFSAGKVGVSTNSYLDNGSVEVWFDNFALWELP